MAVKTSSPASKTPSSKPKTRPPPARDTAITPHEVSTLQSSLTGGSPLPANTRQRMEKGFSQDFSDVRIHTGGSAHAATQRLSAEAFTSGKNIAFSPGAYRPGTKSGDHLLAHELSHVVQQRGSGGSVQLKSLVSSGGDSAEQSADQAADRVAAGKPAGISAGGLSLRGRIMRRARIGARPLSTAITNAPAMPGSARPGSGAVLTPVMTSTISPAGGRLSDSETRKTAKPGEEAPKSKAPDDAQTATADGEASPVTVMVAGTTAGGKEPVKKAKKKGKDTQDKKDKQDDAKDEKEKKDKKDKDAAAGGERKKKKKGKFGQNLGSRGAGAAKAAKKRLRARSGAMKVNEGGGARIGSARAAAAPPSNAAQSAGQRQQAADLESTDVPAPDEATAQQNARAAVSASAPNTIEDLDSFANGAGQAQMAQAITAEAQSQTGPVQQSMSAVTAPPAGPEPLAPIPQPEPQTAGDSAAPALAAATPPPVPEDSLDASEFNESADDALSAHDVDDETLEKANEGPLNAIGSDKKSLKDKVEAAGQRARSSEAVARGSAESGLANAESTSDGDMASERQTAQAGVGLEQESTRLGDETGQQTIADQINTIYQTAQTTVTEKLSTLQTDAVASFREQQGQRLTDFSAGVRRDLDAFKSRRYSGLRGPFRRARDWLLSINSLREVKELYQRHKDQYIRDIDALLATIKTGIETTITECKTALTTARTEIDTLVETNQSSMDSDAQAALARATAQFSQMEANIQRTAQAATAALDRERARAITEMDTALSEIQAENAGLVDKIANAIQALADALGKFLRLMTRITRMGIGAFLGSALSQAKEGMQNSLWGQLQEAFKQWLFMKLPVLQVLLNMPANWMEMLVELGTSLMSLFTENLPAMLPAIGTAAMIWLATTLAAKLIPGVGAIMAVIDAIRGAYALIQSLFTAATAFFDFVMKVANRAGGAGVAFARAIAFGIVAAVDAILTFLGVDRLIRRVVGAIARPFGRIFQRIGARFRAFMARRRRRRRARSNRRGRDGGRGGGNNRNRSARGRARRNRRNSRRRRAQRNRRRDRNPNRNRRRDPNAERRRRRQERERRRAERLRRALPAIRSSIRHSLRDGVSRRRLNMKLRLLKIRHRIRVLRLTPGGRIIAANSPETVVDQARKLDPAALGRLILPILSRAEAAYRREKLSASSRARARRGANRQGRGGSSDPRGGQLSRGQRVESMRRTPLRTNQRGDFGSGVTGQQNRSRGNPQSPSFTTIDIPGATDASYPGVFGALSSLRDESGLSESQISRILGSSRSEQQRLMGEFGVSSQGQSLLHSVTALDDLERARQGDVGTANAVARRVGAVGGLSLDEQFNDVRTTTAGGNPVSVRGTDSSAPAAMVGAVSGERPEQRRRVGNIFRRLQQTAQNADILSQPGGGNLAALSRAVDNWLKSKDPADYESGAVTTLVAQLVALLSSYD